MPLYRYESKIVFFVHIPKTGGTTIETVFKTAGCQEALKFGKSVGVEIGFARVTPQHIHAEIYERLIPKSFYDYGFAIVRNPFDRIASEYKMKVLDAMNDVSADRWITQAFKRYGEFKFTRDNHIRPQSAFLSKHIEIFRFEDGLQNAYTKALGLIGAEVPNAVPHRKKGSPTIIRVKKSTLDRIREFYEVDFDTLQYDRSDFERAFRI